MIKLFLRFNLFVIFLVAFCGQHGYSQVNYESAGILYRDANITVEIKYRIINTCQTQRNCKYQFVITGKPVGFRYINYKMKYYNCDNDITVQPVSLDIAEMAQDNTGTPEISDNIDYTFPGYRLSMPFTQVKTSYSPSNESTTRERLPISMPAQSITGDFSIDYGANTRLSVNGGGLGDQAQWIWYTGQCGGTRVGRGESISVTPQGNTVYYVRAESPSDTTRCVTARVMVNTKSNPADFIDGKSLACKGEQHLPLSVSGGKLGLGAKWVWYQDSCTSRAIGTGARIFVSPVKNTTYLVRAEGLDNITECRQLAVRVVEDRSKDPEKIQGQQVICAGEQLALKVVGGRLASDAEWCWYRNSITPGAAIGKGEILSAKPNDNATYYVRAEGVCNTTKDSKLEVMVNSPSEGAYGVTLLNGNVYVGNKIKLSVSGGNLGNNAEWIWYKKDCENGRRMGSGADLSIRVRRKTTFYVRAEGTCNVSSCVNYTIAPKEKFQFFNIGVIANSRKEIPGQGDKTDLGQMVNNAMDQKSYSFTFGQVKKLGWYLRGKYSFNSTKPKYHYDDGVLINYDSNLDYYELNGKAKENRLAVTGGIILPVLKRSLYVNLGGGYGKRSLLWGFNEVSYQNGDTKEGWALNKAYSFEGFEAEAGLMIKCWILNVMVGANGIIGEGKDNGLDSYFIDVYGGVGFNF
jgi:hypothetical protein